LPYCLRLVEIPSILENIDSWPLHNMNEPVFL
jgi:hypothetical protein